MARYFTIFGILAIIGALVAAPEFVGPYRLEILTFLLIHVIIAQGYRVATLTGDWSLGHLALMGCGAYAAGIMAKFLGWPFWMTIPLGALAAGAIGTLFIFPLLRTRAFGFFITSFALGELIRLFWIRFEVPFGGSRGIVGIMTDPVGGIIFGMQVPYYYLTLGVTLVSLWVLWRLERSRYKYLFEAVQEDEELSESVGISVAKFRMVAFTISSFFAGLAGSLLAHKQMAIDPTLFDINAMVYLIIWVVVGGVGTFAGPIIGVSAMTLVFETTRFLEEMRPLLAGAILILFLTLLPGGLGSLLQRLMMHVRQAAGSSRAGGASAAKETDAGQAAHERK